MISNTAIAALISTCFISLAPNLFLFLFPNYGSSSEGKRSRDSVVLSVGQAIAAGGLLGDVFLHMIPHCMEHSHDGEMIGLLILAGFCVFFFFDIFVRESSSAEEHHHHGTKTPETRNGTSDSSSSSIHASGTFSHTVILSLAADALHNFMDGIAIGTSYATSSSPSSSVSSSISITSVMSLLKSRGGLASISILLHEIPHELGDFAILVDAGFSKTGAIMAQFATAVAAILGTVFGLAAANLQGWGEGVMLPFTAGGFVYLAAVSILPEVLEGQVGVRRRFYQIVAFGVGIAFMWLVSILEHDDHDHGEHDLHHGHSHDHQQHGEL